MADTAALQAYANNQAVSYGIPPSILLNLISQESSWNPNAKGAAGEEGIAQLMPATASNINRFDPYASIHFAAQLLSQYYDKFGSWENALIAYNAGPGRVDNPPSSTLLYVQKIMAGVGLGTGPSAAPVTPGIAKATTNPIESVKILFWAVVAIVGIIVLRGAIQ
jgi:soluble lytic murein transglycosylase-like protein